MIPLYKIQKQANEHMMLEVGKVVSLGGGVQGLGEGCSGRIPSSECSLRAPGPLHFWLVYTFSVCFNSIYHFGSLLVLLFLLYR